eukprot:3889970-Prymnesium_polylepis.2
MVRARVGLSATHGSDPSHPWVHSQTPWFAVRLGTMQPIGLTVPPMVPTPQTHGSTAKTHGLTAVMDAGGGASHGCVRAR